MWIAFRIVFLLMIPNWNIFQVTLPLVVNCFQNCIFTYDSQLIDNEQILKKCCELLSELYFYLWFPTRRIRNYVAEFVVNCFQNCIFTYDSQPNELFRKNCYCCELLSELYFYLWFPTFSPLLMRPEWLWIAFRIVFLLMIPNKG